MALDSSTSSSISNSLGSLAALKTLVSEYPITIDSFLNGNSENSIDFLTTIISMIDNTRTTAQKRKAKKKAKKERKKNGGQGEDPKTAASKVAKTDTLSDIQNIKDQGKAKIAEIFKKVVNQQFLDSLEYAVKGIMFANFKNLFTCDLNPLIPDDLFFNASIDFKVKGQDSPYTKTYNGSGIDIKINDCDTFGLLSYCPLSDAASGSNLYFDCKNRIYNSISDTGKKPTRKKSKNKKTVGNVEVPSLVTQDLWQSCDFNAYLWWVINRVSGNQRPYIWDNRVKVMAKLKDEQTRNAFFDETDKKFLVKDKPRLREQMDDESDSIKDIKRFGIIKCQFIEQSKNDSNVVRVWLNPYRYVRGCYYLKSSKYTHAKTMFLNKTLFEFNYDYIFGLKLFDAKVIVAQIINSVFSISVSGDLKLSLKKQEIEAKVATIVENLINEEDTTIDNCYNKFSNDEYNNLLNKAKLKHEGIVQGKFGVYDEIKYDADVIGSQLSDLNAASTLEEQETIIDNIFTSIEEGEAATTATDTITTSFSYSNTLLAKLLKETILQLVLQILTPKVAFLFKLNSALMGNVDYTKTVSEAVSGEKISTDEVYTKPEFDSWTDFIDNMKELITKLVFVIKDYILQEVLSYVLSLIKPLVEAATIEYAKEAVKYYRDGLKDLLNNCTFSGIYLKNNYDSTTIDNVDYADITAYATKPNYNTCNTNES